jgi:hypothetical protein
MGTEFTEYKDRTGQWFSTEIFFGRNTSKSGEVSEQQFSKFLSDYITPAFPGGMTVYDAYGQMQHSNGQIVKQKTKVVVLVHKNSKADDNAIKKITSAYRNKFGNPQVMLLTRKAKPEFYD